MTKIPTMRMRSHWLQQIQKKGGKKSGLGNKPHRENPNKDKTCSHCKKKGHIKSTCWTKYPDKKPKSVTNRENKQDGKSSVVAGAVEDNKDKIILSAVEDESQYVYLSDKEVAVDIGLVEKPFQHTCLYHLQDCVVNGD
jgi:hypothetical protein